MKQIKEKIPIPILQKEALQSMSLGGDGGEVGRGSQRSEFYDCLVGWCQSPYACYTLDTNL